MGTRKPDVIEDWIARVNDEGTNLTDWERDFMYSITDQWDRTGHLSEKQLDVLERIYTERVS